MTEREKIIILAVECGMSISAGGNGYWDHVDQMTTFYHAAQNEAYEKVLDLKPTALHIFGLDAQFPQGETRDVIEWYDASIRNLKEQS